MLQWGVEARGQPGLLVLAFHLAILLDTVSLCYLPLHVQGRLSQQQASRDPPLFTSHSVRHSDCRPVLLRPALVGAGESNLGPQACAPSPFSAGLFSQSSAVTIVERQRERKRGRWGRETSDREEKRKREGEGKEEGENKYL